MEKVVLQEINIAGVSVRTSNLNQQSSKDMYELWETFLSRGIIHQLPERISDDIYCVYTHYESDHMGPYTAILGYQIPSDATVAEPLTNVKIKTDAYFRFAPKGDLRNELIEKSWQEIWSSDLPRSYHADFEVYGEQAREIENAMVEIFISVK